MTAASAAIDNAWEANAVTTDLLGNSQLEVTGGLNLPGFGPRDIGAFEFEGTGGSPVGGQFRVVSTTLEPIAGSTRSNGGTFNTTSSPTSVTVTFSRNVNPSSVSTTDLVLSGSAINSASPPKVTSLTWIDGHTVQFNLAGQFKSGGTIDVSVPGNTIRSTTGTTNVAYSDDVVLNIGAITPPPVVNPTQPTNPISPPITVPPTITPTPTPAPAPAPKGPLHTKHPVKAKHPAKHHVAPKPAKHAPKPAKHVVHKVKHEPVVKAKPHATEIKKSKKK